MMKVDNYTLSLYQEDQTFFQTTTQSLELSLSLNYSTNYSITITATNCAGTSSSESLTMSGVFMLSLFPPSPRAPSSPVNGSIIHQPAGNFQSLATQVLFSPLSKQRYVQ